ncbi:MAG: energy transducer TonB [Alphaproteobacteria bacterium]
MLGRLIVGIPIAAVVTLGLFFLMQYLIEPKGDITPEEIESVSIDITRAQRKEESESDRELDRPDEQEEPPEPPKIDPQMDQAPDIEGMGASMPNLNPDLSGGLNLGGVLDGDVQPIVRVPPQYPPRALQRGLEGYVVVRFTIDTDGSVKDPEVVESTNSVFNRAALRAVQRWKYRPQIVDGEPRVRPGVTTKIEFTLDENSSR